MADNAAPAFVEARTKPATTRIAATLTTVIFCLRHLTEVIHYPAAAIGIGTMALAALWFRLRSAAIGPAVATHLGYNGLLAILQLAAFHLRH
ncbi:MAG TPA: CPBP family glutamic-type intramembrane protease [Verrucomicrobiae bacterium]|nr:CPBP family glutamic-type intramembrane protease [Verrucomicrobiae bacterium]